VTKSLDQLSKAKDALKVMTHDLGSIPVTKVLALPNTTAEDLKRLLGDEELGRVCYFLLNYLKIGLGCEYVHN
jgi:hypothetical protein